MGKYKGAGYCNDPSKIFLILRVYDAANGNAAEAARLLQSRMENPPSIRTIRNYWKQEGYKLNSQGGNRHFQASQLTEEEIDLVIRRIKMYNSLDKTARILHYNPKKIREGLRKKGLFWNSKNKSLERIIEN